MKTDIFDTAHGRVRTITARKGPLMHYIRPHVGLLVHILAGAVVGTGSMLLWLHVLGSLIPGWAVGLIAGPTALLVLTGLALVQDRRAERIRRRAHARPRPTTRKAA